jgi:hypothetical protein
LINGAPKFAKLPYKGIVVASIIAIRPEHLTPGRTQKKKKSQPVRRTVIAQQLIFRLLPEGRDMTKDSRYSFVRQATLL